MNNNDERDYEEEAFNRALMEEEEHDWEFVIPEKNNSEEIYAFVDNSPYCPDWWNY